MVTTGADMPGPGLNPRNGAQSSVAAVAVLTDEGGIGTMDGWGDGDLIDLNENEWGMFECFSVIQLATISNTVLLKLVFVEPFDTPVAESFQPTPVSSFVPTPARLSTASPKIPSFGATSA